MSYAIGNVVYGFPVTKAIGEALWALGKDWMEMDSFDHCYSGWADYPPGWCGVALCSFNECSSLRVKDLKLTPTSEQIAQAEAMFARLPEPIQKMCPPMDVHIIWGTS